MPLRQLKSPSVPMTAVIRSYAPLGLGVVCQVPVSITKDMITKRREDISRDRLKSKYFHFCSNDVTMRIRLSFFTKKGAATSRPDKVTIRSCLQILHKLLPLTYFSFLIMVYMHVK